MSILDHASAEIRPLWDCGTAANSPTPSTPPTLTLAAPAPVSAPAQAVPQPSREDLADTAHAHLLTSIRQTQQLSPVDRALVAYATRSHRGSGTWEDYIPEMHDRLPSREELLAAMRAFEEAPHWPDLDAL